MFTEHGIVMLSNVLKSKQAILVSIKSALRICANALKMQLMWMLRLAIEEIRKKYNNTKNIEVVFQYLDELIDKKENEKPRKAIGYKLKGKK